MNPYLPEFSLPQNTENVQLHLLKRLSVALEKSYTMTINSKQDYLFCMKSLIKSDRGLHTQKQPL